MKFVILFVLGFSTQTASALSINSYKDSLFDHERVLERRGDFYVIDYDEMRDVNGRDEIPVDKTLDERVYLLDSSLERTSKKNNIRYHVAGYPRVADFIVFFIHGNGGNRDLGFDDWTFGGNFNRLKNLAVRNNGAYVSPTVRFNTNSMNNVGSMISQFKSDNPKAKIILACASQGGSVCWHLASSTIYANSISGMVFLGTAVNMPNLIVPYIKSGKPIVFAHGSSDPILPWKNLKRSYDRIRRSRKGYPIRYYLWDGGIHGSPVRTIDWRLTLNWIF